jgi:hypothetical protein
MADITDISATDPAEVFVEIDKAIRPNLNTFSITGSEKNSLKAYYETMKHAASKLGIEFPYTWDDKKNGTDCATFFVMLTAEVDKKKVDLIAAQINVNKGIALDTAWRDKIHTYVSHIRQVVNSAEDLPIQIKETILTKLHDFDAEVDRVRTRIEVFSDAFVRLCEGVSAGAKALIPAVRLGERLIGALARLSGEPPVLALPPPEQLDLPSPETAEPPADG